jgi:5'-3' exonuclease
LQSLPLAGIISQILAYLLDGTYELFPHFYGQRRFNKGRLDQGKSAPFGAVTGVLHTVLEMIEKGATHLGVATDHVIESFRNRLWPGYKTSQGVERVLLAQFHPLEGALAAMGVAVWPMIELEADDALASVARIAAADESVQKVCIWTPDKNLAQCVRGDRVVQVDRRENKIFTAEGVREKFGVDPLLIPDFLGLVGDATDGYPGIPGIGPKTAALLLNRHGPIESFPPNELGDNNGLALRSRIWRRFGPMPPSSATSTSYVGAVPPRVRRVCGASETPACCSAALAPRSVRGHLCASEDNSGERRLRFFSRPHLLL